MAEPSPSHQTPDLIVPVGGGEDINFQRLFYAGHPDKGHGALPLAVPVQVLELDGGGVVPGDDHRVLAADAELALQPGLHRADGRRQLVIARRALRAAV